ncbi:copper resistance D family protein [Sinorhizobium fredii]|uniref:copper resistance D family protein n=1 Tax=Rhizobium fredii TaxID=380 RepID=UPI001FD20259|nr:CopD family protein [Sinorhizobium fredii]
MLRYYIRQMESYVITLFRVADAVTSALSLSGHAAAAAPQWLMRTAVFLHAMAISFWVGALAPLRLALRRGDPAAVPALRRFSAVIPLVLIVFIAVGVVLATVQVERLHALLDTAYGRVFLVKLGLLVALFLLAAGNRWRLAKPVVAGDGPATKRLVRSALHAAAAPWRPRRRSPRPCTSTQTRQWLSFRSRPDAPATWKSRSTS